MTTHTGGQLTGKHYWVLVYVFLHQRWLNVGYGGKTGNDNNNYMDEACRRARQINNNITVKGRRVTNQTYLGF